MADIDALRAAIADVAPNYAEALETEKFKAAYRAPTYLLSRSFADTEIAIGVQAVLLGKTLLRLRNNSIGWSRSDETLVQLAIDISGKIFDAIYNPKRHNRPLEMVRGLGPYLERCVANGIANHARRSGRETHFDAKCHDSPDVLQIATADQYFARLFALIDGDAVIAEHDHACRVLEFWRRNGAMASNTIEAQETNLTPRQIKSARQFIAQRAKALLWSTPV